MKTNHKLALAVLASVAIGAVGGGMIHAQQTKTGPVYLISEADAITDPIAIKNYGAKVGETLGPFNGHFHFIVAGGKTQALNGGAPPEGIVVIAFDSSEDAHAWYNSPAYQAISPIRQAAVKGRMFLVEGVALH
jgi:uncharacterized protein (DUF1330 family)